MKEMKLTKECARCGALYGHDVKRCMICGRFLSKKKPGRISRGDLRYVSPVWRQHLAVSFSKWLSRILVGGDYAVYRAFYKDWRAVQMIGETYALEVEERVSLYSFGKTGHIKVRFYVAGQFLTGTLAIREEAEGTWNLAIHGECSVQCLVIEDMDHEIEVQVIGFAEDAINVQLKVGKSKFLRALSA